MAFPTSPSNGQIHNNYIYNINVWKRLVNNNKPSFQAYGGSSGSSGIDWIFPFVYLNIGNHYNTNTGIFTVPVSGNYYFSWSNIGNTVNDVYRYRIKKNGISIDDWHLRVDSSATGNEYAGGANRDIIINLLKGDTINIFFTSDEGTASYTAGQYPTFGGYLL